MLDGLIPSKEQQILQLRVDNARFATSEAFKHVAELLKDGRPSVEAYIIYARRVAAAIKEELDKSLELFKEVETKETDGEPTLSPPVLRPS